MKQNQVKRKLYENPRIQTICIEPYGCLLELSGTGGHNKDGDDGSDLNSKQWLFDEEQSIDNQ